MFYHCGHHRLEDTCPAIPRIQIGRKKLVTLAQNCAAVLQRQRTQSLCSGATCTNQTLATRSVASLLFEAKTGIANVAGITTVTKSLGHIQESVIDWQESRPRCCDSVSGVSVTVVSQESQGSCVSGP